jgi:hypothetical protein
MPNLSQCGRLINSNDVTNKCVQHCLLPYLSVFQANPSPNVHTFTGSYDPFHYIATSLTRYGDRVFLVAYFCFRD